MRNIVFNNMFLTSLKELYGVTNGTQYLHMGMTKHWRCVDVHILFRMKIPSMIVLRGWNHQPESIAWFHLEFKATLEPPVVGFNMF